MSAARIASAIVSVALAALLVLAILPAFGPARTVEPTGGVIDGPPDDLPSLATSQEVLQARTFLQEWRGVSGPAPEAVLGEPIIETSAGAHRGDDTPDPVPGEDQ